MPNYNQMVSCRPSQMKFELLLENKLKFPSQAKRAAGNSLEHSSRYDFYIVINENFKNNDM